ncbi:aldehyde dehydrogenase family 3 member H1-like [Dendrobium catenatum]|uniref:Aldehyde dehydrogenase n=1 Tax=Dendrobium catenatum TaxID=906689 RepID=A0A2I0W5B4_9ASPA|nr:aldehyde dehydrogenase family 3 member H1-like [Dendrobium catenatum]PKU70852.1 Aldehyde dehydrogenase family 3 member H1 [Dendrobium catenatum]
MSEDEQRPINDSRAYELVKSLRVSFNSGKTRSYAWRAFQLKGIIRMMDEKEEEIMNALHADLSKPRLESFVHEISLAKSTCSLALKELQQWMKPEKVSSILTAFPSSAEILPEPLGVVLIISAWNYPFLLAIDPVIGAIAAGNSVVLKPSEIAPSTSALFARLLPKYIDNSCIKVVEGTVPETTALLEHKWDKILYTGNAKVGRIIMAAAAKHLTPIVLELGGKCPVVVDSNVDLKVASKRIVVGKWGSNNGQACIAPDYIITTKSFAPQLVDALKISLKSFYGENPMQSEDLSRIVNSNHFARIIRLLDDEKISGKIIHGGERDEKLLKIAPTLLLDVPDDSLIMQEEIFGPLLPIVTVDNIEESIDLINSKPKPLSAYLFTKNKKLEEKFVRAVSAGGLLINDTIMHFANPNLPFGGVGESGIGAYHGKFSFDAFSHRKAVLHRSFGGEVSARYPPYTAQKQKFLRALLSGDIIGVILAIIGFPRS